MYYIFLRHRIQLIQFISYLNTAFVVNVIKTNLSFLGGQLCKNSSKSKNKQTKTKKCDTYWSKWNNINKNYVRRHGYNWKIRILRESCQDQTMRIEIVNNQEILTSEG